MSAPLEEEIADDKKAIKDILPELKDRSSKDVKQKKNSIEYNIANNTDVLEKGYLVEGPVGPIFVKKGAFNYTSPEGTSYQVMFIADDNSTAPLGTNSPIN